jgi:hypothetical protein
VVKRIGNHVQRDLRDEEERKQREIDKKSKGKKTAKRVGGHDRKGLHEDSSMSLHWDDYEGMNETERAMLLERAINVLTTENKPVKRQSGWRHYDEDGDEDEDDDDDDHVDECSSNYSL